MTHAPINAPSANMQPPGPASRTSQGAHADLQASLRHCAPSACVAAWNFRKTGDPAYLPEILAGIIERCAGRDLGDGLRNNSREVNLVQDLGIDSLTMMEIVMHVEDVLPVSISYADLDQVQTVEDFANLIIRNLCDPSQSNGSPSPSQANCPTIRAH